MSPIPCSRLARKIVSGNSAVTSAASYSRFPESYEDDGKLHNSSEDEPFSKWRLRHLTSTRKVAALVSSSCLFLSVIFLVLVEIGNTYNQPILGNIWFIRLDLSNVVPSSVPNSALLSTIARTLGLHDFYQVGLWNYCEGYDGERISNCTRPTTWYWFNPVEIILSQLLAGASIALPSEITDVLDLLQLASHWMFGLFLAGTCVSLGVAFVTPLAVFTQWLSLLLAFFTFVGALFTAAASSVGTVMFVIMRNFFQTNSQVNIGATIGIKMFAFMWTASTLAIIAFIIQLCLTCCCVSGRDIKKRKRKLSDEKWL